MRFLLVLLAALMTLPVGVHAGDDDASTTGNYFANFYRIPMGAAGEIFTLDSDKLKRNALAFGTVALVYTQDEEIRDYWFDNIKSDGLDEWTGGFLYDIGSPKGALWIHGATSVSALMFDDDYLMDTTFLSLQSVIISQVFAESSKRITGRERPRDSGGDSNLWGEGGMSFFSGHSSGAFASMTVFAERYRHQPLVYWGAYGLATATALSRINEDAHWASDTLAGALVGYGVGQLTLRYSPFESTGNTVLLPVVSPDVMGLAVFHAF
ncbi:PAP2 superfamily protein [Marinospirillum celere]|uniref:PAP2 superfamily protein n=1 Tax=Marinospirillum celere TaxID=1122252 RepID=A0A1I1EC47_9GAMM|nr:phosphatase PAP2 family protein [Marinospirillum celere]SFB84142.1 PAP2 superfamily protein [Marinospirillum celere]